MMMFAQKKPRYPKGHLLAASGIAAVLSFALLIFPSRQVEAKRSLLEYNFDASQEFKALEQDLREAVESGSGSEALEDQVTDTSIDNPFPRLPHAAKLPDKDAESTAPQTAKASVRKIQVKQGDTLFSVFTKAGYPSTLAHDILKTTPESKVFTQIKRGQTLEFHANAQGQLHQVRTQTKDHGNLILERNETGQGYSLKTEHSKPQTGSAYTFGVINSSLVESARSVGLSYALTMDLAKIFGYDIDFALDLQKGDTFEVIYEEKQVKGKNIGAGHILAARFTNQGKTYTAIRYKAKGGGWEYYNAQGDSMRKAFIRTPVDVARITSGFSAGRRHPILNKIRAHKGVDYAAPTGTPIRSSGNGKIVMAGRNGGYGNTVIIQHGQRYRTLYAHMQGFARGIREGSNVKQGQIIGYIGTTGLSTGPHLHYEFQVDGQHIDPLSEKLPTTNPLVAGEKTRFLQMSRSLLARMDQEKSTLLALNQL